MDREAASTQILDSAMLYARDGGPVTEDALRAAVHNETLQAIYKHLSAEHGADGRPLADEQKVRETLDLIEHMDHRTQAGDFYRDWIARAES